MNTLTLEGLKLTEEEAFAILALALTSTQGLDSNSERALKKLARYCTSISHSKDHSKQSEKTIHLNVG